jgi:outer membrane protein assembly factor BamB
MSGAALLTVIGIILAMRTGGTALSAPTGVRQRTRLGQSGAAASPVRHWTAPGWLASLEAKVKGQPGHLAPGSDPAVLPGPVLIADRNNNRLLLVDPKGRVLWQFPGQGRRGTGQALRAPDDAFFGPHGRHIIATQESQAIISVLSPKTGRLTWQYGHPGVPGSAPGYLHNPDDAMLLPGGNVMTADIKNCRLLELSRTSKTPLHVYGTTDPFCYHAPPRRFGSPNGMFPMTNGDWLVTEINGDWVDEMTPAGKIVWSVHPPGITYPSDTNEVSPGVFLTASYTRPGVIEEFTKTGKLLWRYEPKGSNALNEPSLALPLPNGDILANADWSDRVVVIDPKTNRIVWQYGHTGVPGSGPGYLYKPDGVDLAPPHSLLTTHAATMGTPPYGRPARR